MRMMKMMMKCKLPALCMALVMLWAFCAQAEEVNPDQPVQLTVSMQWQGHSVVGVPIKLYRIAEKDASGQWQLIAPFDRYNVDIHVESESDMARIASTLEGYILRDNLPPGAGGQDKLCDGERVADGRRRPLYRPGAEQSG